MMSRLPPPARAVALTAAGWTALTLVLWWRYAPNGYNTSDYGFVIGQSWRALHGEIPHRDFISARPAGSALLHTIDFALPMPLVESSRLVCIVMVVGIALLSGVAVLGRAPWRWTWIGHGIAATCALFTLNTFQIGPWYTTDGILFSIGAFAALRMWQERDGADLPVLGLLAAGAAPLFKQSFFVTPIVAAVWVLLVLHSRRQMAWRKVVLAALMLAAPGLSYLFVMVVTGSFSPMVSQLTSATEVDWAGYLDSVSVIAAPTRAAAAATAVLALIVLLWFRRPVPGSEGSHPMWRALAGAAAFLLTVALGLAPHLNMYDPVWSSRLFWLAATATLVAGATDRVLRRADVALVLVSWMSVLSWGLPWPLLTSGGMVFVLAQLGAEVTGDAMREATAPIRQRLPWAIAGVVAFVGTAVVLDDAIENRVIHRDLPASHLSVRLDSIDADFGRARTNPTTAAFVRDAVECVAEHPADGVVFGSWNSDLYAMFDLTNPLATDGSNGYEITGAEDQFRDSVHDLAARGDFLVLFPLVNPESVHVVPLDQLPEATVDTPIPEYWFTEVVPYNWMAEQVGGEKVACGSWVGVYEPERRDG